MAPRIQPFTNCGFGVYPLQADENLCSPRGLPDPDMQQQLMSRMGGLLWWHESVGTETAQEWRAGGGEGASAGARLREGGRPLSAAQQQVEGLLRRCRLLANLLLPQ